MKSIRYENILVHVSEDVEKQGYGMELVNDTIGQEADGRIAELHSVHLTHNSAGTIAVYIIAWVPEGGRIR